MSAGSWMPPALSLPHLALSPGRADSWLEAPKPGCIAPEVLLANLFASSLNLFPHFSHQDYINSFLLELLSGIAEMFTMADIYPVLCARSCGLDFLLFSKHTFNPHSSMNVAWLFSQLSSTYGKKCNIVFSSDNNFHLPGVWSCAGWGPDWVPTGPC